MPVRTHFRFVFRGVFVDTPEIWSYSMKFQRDVGGGGDANISDIDDGAVTDAATAFHADPMFQSNVKLTEWRVYRIGTNNKMEGNPGLFPLPSAGAVGTGTSRAYPTDTALCVTTVATDRGHARYGRFYLPGPHAQLGSDRLIATSWLDPVLERCVQFVKSISDAIDLPAVLNSSSMLNISNDADSTWKIVDHLKVGRVLDHIGRRRSALLEDYREGTHIDW
jgi:hypothetical protein